MLRCKRKGLDCAVHWAMWWNVGNFAGCIEGAAEYIAELEEELERLAPPARDSEDAICEEERVPARPQGLASGGDNDNADE